MKHYCYCIFFFRPRRWLFYKKTTQITTPYLSLKARFRRIHSSGTKIAFGRLLIVFIIIPCHPATPPKSSISSMQQPCHTAGVINEQTGLESCDLWPMRHLSLNRKEMRWNYPANPCRGSVTGYRGSISNQCLSLLSVLNNTYSVEVPLWHSKIFISSSSSSTLNFSLEIRWWSPVVVSSERCHLLCAGIAP